MPLVLNNDLHHPAILAKAIAALTCSGRQDHRRDRRGWLADDYKALGVDCDTAPSNDRSTEAFQIITLFTGLPMTLVAVTPAGRPGTLPRSVQDARPPVLVGGGHRGCSPSRLTRGHRGVHARLGPANSTQKG